MITTSTIIILICTLIITISTIRLIFAHKQLIQAQDRLIKVYKDYSENIMKLYEMQRQQEEKKKPGRPKNKQIIIPN